MRSLNDGTTTYIGVCSNFGVIRKLNVYGGVMSGSAVHMSNVG